MKSILRNAALGLMAAPPIYHAIRFRALRGNPVTILCYHTLRPATEPLDAWIALSAAAFRLQISRLREIYDIVPLDAALEPAMSATPRLVLTFDDGEVGLHTHLLPIVKAEALPVTIYVATQHIETGEPFWFDKVMNALQGEGITQIALPGLGRWEVGPLRGKSRWVQISRVLEAIKTADPVERDMLAEEVVLQAGPIADGFTPLQPMRLDQLQEIAENPHVTIGAHSHGHELLNQITLQEARASIARSRELLRDWTGQEVLHFAYPNGNYTSDLMAALEDLGFKSATILEDRLMVNNDPHHALPRIGVGRYDSLARLRLRMVGC